MLYVIGRKDLIPGESRQTRRNDRNSLEDVRYEYSKKKQLTFFIELIYSCFLPCYNVPNKNLAPQFDTLSSSDTQGQSVGLGERVRRKFLSKGERAPRYRLSPSYFQKFKRMPAPDWAQKKLCIIVPNRRTVSPQFFA